MSRSEFSKATKLDAWRVSRGRCMKCTAKLLSGEGEYHHDKECTFGGDCTLENCILLCRACHSEITKKRAAVIAKSNRIRNRHIGIKRPRTITGWKNMRGEAVRAPRER